MSSREKDRKLRRRQRRRNKLRNLKQKLAQAKTEQERRHLIQKINKISLYKITPEV
jgi:hypothetical protein